MWNLYINYCVDKEKRGGELGRNLDSYCNSIFSSMKNWFPEIKFLYSLFVCAIFRNWPSCGLLNCKFILDLFCRFILYLLQVSDLHSALLYSELHSALHSALQLTVNSASKYTFGPAFGTAFDSDNNSIFSFRMYWLKLSLF